MNFHNSLQHVFADLSPSLSAVRPEMMLCAGIVLVLLARMIVPVRAAGQVSYLLTLLATSIAVWFLFTEVASWVSDRGGIGYLRAQPPREIFTGLLVRDGFCVVLRAGLLAFAVLFVAFTRISRVPEDADAAEFYVMILGASLGLCIMVMANHVMMVFLGIEMASVPCYVLAGILRHRRPSSEAALKYAVFGAAAAGVMLYGLSLLCGVLGTAHLPTMAERLAEWLPHTADSQYRSTAVVLLLGGLMTMVGLAFKLSAVPFHFWAPDVFEGAPAEVGMFLSIASKAAAVALLTRLALTFSGGRIDPSSGSAAILALAPVRTYLAGLIALFAAVTCTFGNLAAYGQTNIKRLLAYSTIAHAGYMMMPVAAAVALSGDLANRDRAAKAVAAIVVYMGIYLFMNFGAFAIAAFVRNARQRRSGEGGEAIADYAGMIRRSPAVAVSFAAILFSLVGLPPLAGFAAKFAAFAALLDANLYLLLIIGGLNTAVSLFYYLRVVKVMVLEPELEERPAPAIPLLSAPGIYATALSATMLLIFVRWEGLWSIGHVAGRALVEWTIGR